MNASTGLTAHQGSSSRQASQEPPSRHASHQDPRCSTGAHGLPAREPLRRTASASPGGLRPETAGQIRATRALPVPDVFALGKALAVSNSGAGNASTPQLAATAPSLPSATSGKDFSRREDRKSQHRVDARQTDNRSDFEKDVVRGKQVGGMQAGTGALAAYLLGPWVGH